MRMNKAHKFQELVNWCYSNSLSYLNCKAPNNLIMQVFNSFSLTFLTLLVRWKFNSFKTLVSSSCEWIFSFKIYIDYTVHVILRHLLHLYFVTTKASLDILLVMLLDITLIHLILYILFTNLCVLSVALWYCDYHYRSKILDR